MEKLIVKLKEELSDVYEKLTKLEVFIDEKPKNTKVTSEHSKLLYEQKKILEDYYDILEERIYLVEHPS